MTHRCFVNSADWASGGIRLPPDEEHHLLHVLRAKTGDAVCVFDGHGRTAVATLEIEAGRRARLHVKSEETVPRPAPSVTLLACIPKGDRMDWIVEKATELGAARIVPVVSERVVAKLNARQREDRVARWQRVARSAAKQCGTGWLPDLDAVLNYPDSLALAPACDLFVVGSLFPDAAPLHAVMDARRGPCVRTAALLIGPEGDLTAGEMRDAIAAGATPVRFGPLVMRVDTAAVFGLSVLMYELGARPPAPPNPPTC